MINISIEGNINSKDLSNYVYKNDVKGVKECLKENVIAMDMKNTHGKTPLMIAATLNRIQISQVLLDLKCDVNVTDDLGFTALHMAVEEGNTEIVQQLVHCGLCMIDATNVNGETALMKAAFYDYVEIAKILLVDGKSDINVKDRSSKTALLTALHEGSHATVDLLLKAGCDVNITDNLGQSALYTTVHSPCNKTLDLARKLINSGYDLSIDKIWLMNEEKQNIIYQDDAFYAEIRRKLKSRSFDTGTIDKMQLHTKPMRQEEEHQANKFPISAAPSLQTAPMSPTLMQRLMSPGSPKFPIASFKQYSQDGVDLYSPNSSPLLFKRHLFANFGKSKANTPLDRPTINSSFALDFDDSITNSRSTRPKLASQSMKESATYLEKIDITGPKTVKALSLDETIQAQFSTKLNARLVNIEQLPPRSAPCSPLCGQKRMASVPPTKYRSFEETSTRKTSVPCKPEVKFCAQVTVVEFKRRL